MAAKHGRENHGREQTKMAATSEGIDGGGEAVAARGALEAYRRGDFAQALGTLRSLLKRQPGSLTVLHNIAVNEYARDRAAAATAAGAGGTNNANGRATAMDEALGNKLEMILTARTASATEPLAAAGGATGPTATGGPDRRVAYAQYNLAVLATRRRAYADAERALAGLATHLDALDEALALRVCFLRLDVHLRLGKLDAATALVDQIERNFVGLLVPDGGVFAHFRAGGDAGSADMDADLDADEDADAAGGDDADGGSDADDVGASVPAAGGAAGRAPIEPGVTERNSRLLLHLYKARLHLALRALKPAKREVKAALALNRSNATALFLQAHVDFIRGRPKKAAKLLHTAHRLLAAAAAAAAAGAPVDSSAGAAAAAAADYHNDLACVYHQVGKHAAAAAAFAHAFNLGAGPGAARAEVAYNYALVLLRAGLGADAYAILSRTTAAFADRPLFWLRVAEACIADYHRATSAPAVVRLANGGFQLPVFGTGAAAAGLGWEDAGPALTPPLRPTLSYGLQCLLNARALLDRSAGPAAPPELRTAVHSALAYVLLQLRQLGLAMHFARLVTASPSASAQQRHLMQLYTALALLELRRPDDATEALLQALRTLDVAAPTALADAAALRLNLAAVRAVAKDLNRAEALLAPQLVPAGPWPDAAAVDTSTAGPLAVSQGVWTATGPHAAAATLLGVYILLARGRPDRARLVLDAGQRTPDLFVTPPPASRHS